MMDSAKTVDQYIQNQPQWSEALIKLRKILMELGLEETIKWGGHVYMFKQKNLVPSFASSWKFC